MRSSTRLITLIVLLVAVISVPVQGQSSQDGSPWHGSSRSIILAMYSSPLQWLWTAVPATAVEIPMARPAGTLVLSAPTPERVSATFMFDDGLTMGQRLSEMRRINACLEVFPERLKAPLTRITVKAGEGNPRALSDGKQIIIHSVPLSDEELCNVVAHEMGHVIDLGLFTGVGFEGSPFRDGQSTVLSDDLSVQFYSVSWKTDVEAKDDATRLDFVTGYARSNVFEEFGEMTELYIRQGNYLRSLLPTSPALQAKYAFLRDRVFEGTEFNTGKAAENVNARKFDSTLVGIRYN